MSLRPGGGAGLNPFASFGKGAAPNRTTRVRYCYPLLKSVAKLDSLRQCPMVGTIRHICKLGGRVTGPHP